MTFITGVADEQMAFMSLSLPLCEWVERTYFLYSGMRHKDQLNRWDHTIKLYRVWSQRRRKHELDATQASLSTELMKATKDAAPIRPIGA
jgi:hypothetical protein